MSSDEAQLGQVTFISSELWSAYLRQATASSAFSRAAGDLAPLSRPSPSPFFVDYGDGSTCAPLGDSPAGGDAPAGQDATDDRCAGPREDGPRALARLLEKRSYALTTLVSFCDENDGDGT